MRWLEYLARRNIRMVSLTLRSLSHPLREVVVVLEALHVADNSRCTSILEKMEVILSKLM